MNTDELSYCLAKQLARAHTVQTDYGDIALDEEMRAAMDSALRPIIEQRLKRHLKDERMSQQEGTTGVMRGDW